MLSFRFFLSEAKLNASGKKAQYDTDKYIRPFLKGREKHTPLSHEVNADVGHIKKGERVTLHTHHIDENGVHHVVVSKAGSNKKIAIPTSKIVKQSSARNVGLQQESVLVDHLNKHGLMSGTGAGSGAGNDFHLLDKRTRQTKRIQGSEASAERALSGEHKANLTAAVGQLTLTRHPKTGEWHISDAARARRPEYARHVENATITNEEGKKVKLLDHLNKTQPPGYTAPAGRTTAEDIHSDEQDLGPAHAYMRDHDVDLVHFDSHGTYRAGRSERTDRQKLGLPVLKGTGRFRVRQKQVTNPNSRTVQFSIRRLEKSHTHIGTDEGATKIKEILGHKEDAK
jgi:hypothetical protein